jgi:TPR repeat protein
LQHRYGAALEYGKGVQKDLAEAAKYYKLAADQGDAFGQSRYASVLHGGKGVSQNVVEAAKY